MRSIRLVAPAKVNLCLAIGPARGDGYHNATTAMHALAMHDTIRMVQVPCGEFAVLMEPCDAAQPMRQYEVQVPEGSGLAVTANIQWHAGLEPMQIADEDNLACRAVRELSNKLGRACDEVIRMVIEKSIPTQSGLGGGSSDAAAALVGVAHLWGLGPNDERVEEVARTLGADVPFFLHGGCTLLDGMGECFVRSLEPSKDAVVVIKPEGGVPTAEAYRLFDEVCEPVPQEVLDQMGAAESAAQVPLFNNLAPASERLLPVLAEVRGFAEGFPGVRSARLTGSGAATYCICDSYEAGQALSAAAQAHGWWARCTSFTSLAASILPE